MILGILSDLAPWEGSSQCFLDDLPGRGTLLEGGTLAPGSIHIMQGSLFSLSHLLSKISGLSQGRYPSLKCVDSYALNYFRVIFRNSLLYNSFVYNSFQKCSLHSYLSFLVSKMKTINLFLFGKDDARKY